MNFRIVVVAFIAIIYATLLVAAPRPAIVSAEPHAQSTAAPTEEPTKRPYVFPTPVFIPTYADDTPVPRGTPSATPLPIQPGADTYTVQSGDSLWLIAQKVYGDGSKYKLILDANGMTDQSRLRVGAVLKIPNVPGVVVPSSSTVAPSPTLESQPGALPTFVPTSTALPGLATSPTPKPSGTSTESLPTIINLVSAILFIAAIACGVLAYLRYVRLRRLERLSSPNQPIRIKQ